MNPTHARSLGPAVAGTWYPADRESLSENVAQLLGPIHEAAGGSPPERIVALIAPHAGFVYSGRVAGAGFRQLRGMRYDTVLLLGPSHYEGFAGATVPTATEYRTPLGTVEIDTEATRALAERPGFRATDRPFVPEHCLEAELPFLQQTLADGWRLVPLLVGAGSSRTDLEQIAAGLSTRLSRSTLIVVSSDFTHYGARFGYVPFSNDSGIEERIRELDSGAIDRIVARDANAFRDYVDRTGATICGRAAIDILLRMLPADASGELLDYDTSGRMTGSWDHTVSYANLIFRVPEPAGGSS